MSSSQPQISLPLLVRIVSRAYTRQIYNSLSLLQDLVQPITHDIALEAFSREKRSRQPCPSCGAIHNSRASSGAVGKGHYVDRPGQDIYGRAKQHASESGSYFECANCARKVAASRYAAHLERCLGGRGARNKKYASYFCYIESFVRLSILLEAIYWRMVTALRYSSAAASSSAPSIASPISLSPSSPYVTEDESPPTKPAAKRRKLNGAAKGQQHAHGVSTLPNSPATDAGHELDNHSDPGEITGRPSAKTAPGRSSEKTLPGMSSYHKSQVSKFLDRVGSPILQSTDNYSGKGRAGIKLENVDDE
ncbi:hypothetical protein LIPSTDRAFT_60599 [Lipomyces starkeyi NRRL Y-11557]|uniref:SAGA-associated factor 11 n=1 Tax=Lipomyces starkeyi NRRL Y-11557 TaxID=675824 RepID=A0A1E3QFK3_LIPST|nr:hypothetical protein LIPSTDRAFT_60599 [Lipomyces starkeyi NRRL Y-11557]